MRFTAVIALAALALVLVEHDAQAARKKAKAYDFDPIPSVEDDSLVLDMENVREVRRLSTAGYILSIGGLATMIASWVTYFPDVGQKRENLSLPWLGLMISWGAIAAVGVPLLLAAEYKVRKMLGLPGVDGYFIAGCFFLGIGYASLAFIDAQPVYTMLYATIGYTAAVLWSWYGAGRALRKLKRIENVMQQEKNAYLAPYVMPVDGGAMAGVAGAF